MAKRILRSPKPSGPRALVSRPSHLWRSATGLCTDHPDRRHQLYRSLSVASTFQGPFNFEIIQAPENSLRDTDGLLGLIGRANSGDTILVQQLGERPHWGLGNSNAAADPNPRLEAYVAAARRGASVRLLLDSFFDDPSDPTSNTATCQYVRDIALSERLNLKCALANPTGMGIHNKMILARINGQGYIHIGSLNGSEQSSKGNRELALQVQSNEAYALLAELFLRLASPGFPPLVFQRYHGPASYPLISELLYDPIGPDDTEFVELVNPTSWPVDLSFFSLGDAVNRTISKMSVAFRPGTIILPGRTLVVAAACYRFPFPFWFPARF